MKKIYLKPSTKTFVVELPALMDNSVPLNNKNEATTDAGEYKNALSRGGSFWDDEEEDF